MQQQGGAVFMHICVHVHMYSLYMQVLLYMSVCRLLSICLEGEVMVSDTSEVHTLCMYDCLAADVVLWGRD